MIKNQGSKIALTFGDKKISYNDFIKKTNHFSTLFTITSGTHCAIFSENRLGWVYAFYSIWLQKGVAVPIDHLSTVPETTYILKDAAPAVVFCSKKYEQSTWEAIYKAEIPTPKVIIIDEYEETDVSELESIGMPEVENEDTALIIYTSGTTGTPKGVMLSYKNIIYNCLSVSKNIEIYTEDSKVLVLLPLHHVLPLVGSIIVTFFVGATACISPSLATEDIMQTLQQNKITLVIGVPRLYALIHKGIITKVNQSFAAKKLLALARKLKWKAFSRTVFKTVHKKFGGSLQTLVSGGAALDKTVGGDFVALGFDVLEGFGMTEAAPMITFTRPSNICIGSPGQVVPGAELKIVDGEIATFGDNVMKGYYNRPEETDEVLRDGWLYTGDLGYIDEKGFLFITGRKKEIIVLSNGKKLNPNEIEEEIMASELVTDCGVFHFGDALQLLIVPSKTAYDMLGDETLEDFFRAKLLKSYNESVSTYKKIQRLHFTDAELPRTRLGKIQRFKLHELVEKTEITVPEKIEKIESEVYNLIAAYLEEEKQRKVVPTMHIENDLELDSLEKIGLQSYIYNAFGVRVDAAHLASYENILALSEYIETIKVKAEDVKINWHQILHEKTQLKLPKTWFTKYLIAWFSRAFFTLYFRFHTRGVKNIPEGPVIIAPNHQSFFDGLFVTAYLRYKQVRETYFYAKEKHVKKPWLKFFANRNNVIVMDLTRDLKESIQKLGEVLKENKKIIIFPEGTRSKTGKLGEFKKTFAILSRELNVPIVPVSISGANYALPSGSIFPRPWKRINIDFMNPIYPEGKTYETIAESVREKIERCLQKRTKQTKQKN